MAVDLYMVNMLILVSMTLIMMQGQSGSAKAISVELCQTTKQVTCIKLATTVGLFFFFT